MRNQPCRGYLVLLLTQIVLASPLPAKAQAIELLHPTNTVWRYMAPMEAPLFGTDWKDPLFGDTGSEWQSGVGLFGHETGGLGTIYADNWRFNTAIPPPSQGLGSGPMNAFFRTRFTWSGDTQNVVLVFTNYVDDGIAIFLNGTEIYRFLLNGNPGEPVQFHYSPQAGQSPSEPVRTVFALRVTDLPSGLLRNGENSIAVYVGQGSLSSPDVVFGMSLHAHECTPLLVMNPPPGGTNIVIAECVSATLTAEVSTISPPAYQWFHSGVALSTATNAWLTITNPRPGVHNGAYTVRATNLCGSVTSAPINVMVALDTTPPRLLCAEVNSTHTQIKTSWSEPLAAPDSSTPSSFSVHDNAGSELNTFLVPTVQNETNLLIPIASEAWVPSAAYYVRDLGGGARDRCKGLSSPASNTRVRVPLFFRNGLNDYAGTQDAELRGDGPDMVLGDGPNLRIDTDEGSPPVPRHGLLRFDGLFGKGQLLCGTSIQLAVLRLTVSDIGAPVKFHRMLADWEESTATWNSLVNGITNDNREAEELAVATLNANEIEIDVTRSVREWANGATNFGWALLPTGSDSVTISSSEDATATNRPELRVFLIEDLAVDPCLVIWPLPASITIDAGQTLTISVDCPGSPFQWQKRSAGVFTDIPGATNATYTKSGALPGDSGNYRVIMIMPCVTLTSRVVVVTVRPPPMMWIERGPNAVIVSWNPATGVLEESVDLVMWNASENQASGTARPLATARFFRVRQ